MSQENIDPKKDGKEDRKNANQATCISKEQELSTSELDKISGGQGTVSRAQGQLTSCESAK